MLPAGFQRKYNREYHAVIENDKLAAALRDISQARPDLSARRPRDRCFAAPDLFMPEEEEGPVDFAAPPQFFKPLRLNREGAGSAAADPGQLSQEHCKLIQSAKKSVWFQNQYINFRGTDDDFSEFRAFDRRTQRQDRQGP